MINTTDKNLFIAELEKIVGSKSVLKTKWSMESYCKGWRYGEGEAIAVAKPSTLLQIWKILQVCVEKNIIVIMQAANTGLTGGSTPYGYDYDRPILVVNTMLIDDIHIIDDGKQIVGFPGSTLFELENKFWDRFVPRYSMVSFHEIPYSEVFKRGVSYCLIRTKTAVKLQTNHFKDPNRGFELSNFHENTMVFNVA